MLIGQNVLVGVLAHHLQFVSRDDLIGAMKTWLQDKDRSLGVILAEQERISEDVRALLEVLAERHLAQHGHDPQRSLSALSAGGEIRQLLEQFGDSDVNKCLHTAAGPAAEAGATLDTLPRNFGSSQPLEPGSAPPTLDVPPPPLPHASLGPPAAERRSRFRILRPHARGGLGEVFVAHDEEVQREVALKEMQAKHSGRPESRARFLSEAQVTGQLEHPGIVPVYGLGTYADGRPFYAMRFIRGDSLEEAIRHFHQAGPKDSSERALELRRLLGRFLDVCNAIAYAHSKGILHRDLKPGNIMLGEYGETLVVDWGLAKHLQGPHRAPEEVQTDAPPSDGPPSGGTHEGDVIGTPSFMPPEQAAGRIDQLGPASDVYSLGATLYALLTGKVPFSEQTLSSILEKVQTGEFISPREVNPEVPPALEAVCLKAMALRPEDRYVSPRALADDVEQWLADEPVAAYPEPWTARVRRWMRRHRTLVAAAAVLLVIAAVALTISTILIEGARQETDQQRLLAEAALAGERQAHERRARAQVRALLDAKSQAVPGLLDELRQSWGLVLPLLEEESRKELPAKHRVRVQLALLGEKPGAADFLGKQLLDATPSEMLLIRDQLQGHGAPLVNGLWQLADNPLELPDRRFRALVALAAFLAPNDPRWARKGKEVVEGMLTANELALEKWTEALRPMRAALREPLVRVFEGKDLASRKGVAATLLADYCADQPAFLADMLIRAAPEQFVKLWPTVSARKDEARPVLLRQLAREGTDDETLDEADLRHRHKANAAAALFLLGERGHCWPLLRHAEDPGLRTHLIHRFAPLGVEPLVLFERLAEEKNPGIQQALVLALGEFPDAAWSGAARQSAEKWLREAYTSHADAGVHSACAWLLRRWGHAEEVRRLDRTAAAEGQAAARGWFVNPEGQTFVRVRGPVEYTRGTQAGERGREEDEVRTRLRIPRSFAVATREVTVEEFRRFLDANPALKKDRDYIGMETSLKKYSPAADGPVLSVTWFQAAAYCRWLSEKEGVPEMERCFPPLADIKEGMELPANYLTRTGYRLPTESEWEFTCRAGTATPWHFGSDEGLLDRYGTNLRSASDGRHERAWQAGRLKPNPLGTFDMHGNVIEWCLDRLKDFRSVEKGKMVLDIEEEDCKVIDKDIRPLRGGSFADLPPVLRSGSRVSSRPLVPMPSVGFRLARTVR